MGHGHFDRLNILYYDNGTEVFSDYGAARFINIETKGGGGYLKENTTWAKQTVAHNTLVVDQTSNFKAELAVAEKNHPDKVAFKADQNLQVVSAREDNAFPGVKMLRTSALFKPNDAEKWILIDVFQARSDSEHQYDLPFWYKGNIVSTSFKVNAVKNNLQALGTDYGYQHIWLNSKANVPSGNGYITLLNDNNFYTTTFATGKPLNVQLVSIGANDPEMNLLEGKGFILSQPKAADQTFVSITENHGKTDPIAEVTTGAQTSITDLLVVGSDDNQTSFSFKFKGKAYTVSVNYQNKSNFIQIN
jgi:oligo-alginate lyase